MRGRRNPQSTMPAFVNLDERVPPDHPLRTIKRAAADVLDRMSSDFTRMYSKIGGPRCQRSVCRRRCCWRRCTRCRVREPSARNWTTTCSTARSRTWT